MSTKGRTNAVQSSYPLRRHVQIVTGEQILPRLLVLQGIDGCCTPQEFFTDTIWHRKRSATSSPRIVCCTHCLADALSG
jgi:hypothetical protein